VRKIINSDHISFAFVKIIISSLIFAQGIWEILGQLPPFLS